MLAVGLLWFGSRIAYWNGYYTEDAPGYVTDAIWVVLGEYHARQYVNGLNVGTYLPVAGPIWLLGKSELALSLWPLTCSLLGVVSMAGSTTILFGRAFGVLAAFLYASYPGDVFFSTVVMPDSIQAGWLSFSVFLIVWSFAGPASRRQLWLAAGGLALGICHLVRANDVMFVPVGVALVAVMSRTWRRESSGTALRRCAVFLSAWMLVVTLEGLVYLWAADDFLLRIRVVHHQYGTIASIAQWGLNTDPRTIPFSILSPLAWWARGGWGHLNQDQAYHALLFWWAFLALLTGLAIAVIRRGEVSDRSVAGIAVAGVWLCWPLLYHQFGSQSLTEFVPVHRLSRHLVVYAPGAMFAAVAGCCLVDQAMSTRRAVNGRRTLVAAGLAALLVHSYFNWSGIHISYDAYHRIKNTYARIREHLPRGVNTIVGDPGDLCFFDFWLNPIGREPVAMVPFANYSRCEDFKSGIVLTHSNPGWGGSRPEDRAPVIQSTVSRLPCLVEPPANWQLVYTGYPEKIYRIERQGER